MMNLVKIFVMVLARIIKYRYKVCPNTNKALMFIPHSGMCIDDKYDLFNFQSESAYTLARYIIDNKLKEGKKIYLFAPSDDDIERLQKRAFQAYPERKIEFLSWRAIRHNYRDFRCLKDIYYFCKCFNECSHVFTSITENLKRYKSDQILVDVGYYSAPFKNDLIDSSDDCYLGMDTVGREYDKLIFASELALRLVMPSMSLPHSKFAPLGMCRNDNLLNGEKHNEIRQEIINSVSYPVKKIVLYPPTHRDYEQNSINNSRPLLGFNADNEKLDSFLKSNGVLILCKFHPKQNKEIVSTKIPESIKLYEANNEYGLCELMQISDALMTDYSSAYLDYLLLDKPVIFNFYDFDKYIGTRGMTYEPIESVLAGPIFKDVDGFMQSIMKLEEDNAKFREKRLFVRDLFFAYKDTNNCQRVYNYFFRD